MVLPLADDNSDRRIIPYVNLALIGVNVFVFIFLQRFGTDDRFTNTFATVPREIVTGHDVVTEDRVARDPDTGQIVIDPDTGKPLIIPGLQPTPFSVYITLITSMFMHGGIAHILGNMLFLYIFGDNVEDALGHARYLIFYLVCGILASLSQVFAVVLLEGVDSRSALVPSLGASGAISGVLGGYILLYPTRRVLVLLLRVLVWVPAYVAIGIWFLFQFVEWLGVLGGSSEKGGVAYAAHVGGFVFGIILVKVFAIGGPGPAPTPAVPWPDEQDRY